MSYTLLGNARSSSLTLASVCFFMVSFVGMTASECNASIIVALGITAVDSQGTPVSFVQTGEQFTIEIRAQDLRLPESGVFSAYFGMGFDQSLVRPASSHSIGDAFPLGHTDFAVVSGLLEDVGGTRAAILPAVGTSLVMSQTFVAEGPGNATFALRSARLPHHEVTVFGRDTGLRSDEIMYGQTSVSIVPEPSRWFVVIAATLVIVRQTRRMARPVLCLPIPSSRLQLNNRGL